MFFSTLSNALLAANALETSYFIVEFTLTKTGKTRAVIVATKERGLLASPKRNALRYELISR